MAERRRVYGIHRAGSKVKIDVLACRREIEAGTFSAADQLTLERMLPGVYEELQRAHERDSSLAHQLVASANEKEGSE